MMQNANGRIIEDVIKFQYEKLGYIDLELASKMTGIPSIIVKNVILNNNYIESNRKNQFIKK